MAKQDRPLRISREVSVQQIGNETLVYDGTRHLAFCLNSSSAVVWNLADGARTLADIRSAAELELSADLSEELVRYAIATLRRDGLIEPVSEAEMHASRTVSRRAMLQRLGAGGAMLLPLVASIVAPTAAQAYNGCVDCSTSNARAARSRRLQQSK